MAFITLHLQVAAAGLFILLLYGLATFLCRRHVTVTTQPTVRPFGDDDEQSIGPAPDEDDEIAAAEYRELRRWSEQLDAEDRTYVAERIRDELRRRIRLIDPDPEDAPEAPDWDEE